MEKGANRNKVIPYDNQQFEGVVLICKSWTVQRMVRSLLFARRNIFPIDFPLYSSPKGCKILEDQRFLQNLLGKPLSKGMLFLLCRW